MSAVRSERGSSSKTPNAGRRRASKRQSPVPPEDYIRMYEQMLKVYYVEERTKAFVRANKCSFHASSRGHEKLQIALSMVLEGGRDWFYPYYREKALAIGLGVPLKDIFLHMLSRKGDPSGEGRNMSEHFSSPALRIVSPTGCTGTQYLPAVGTARAVSAGGRDEIVYVSSGEGATSEGEFFEAVNWASRERLPVLFVVQNNGLAITVPQSVQTRADLTDIARSFGIQTCRFDGTRFTQMYLTLQPIVEDLRKGKGPVLVEGLVERLDSHSSSDDHRKYRTEEELDRLRKKDPLAHTEAELVKRGIITTEDVKSFRERIREEVDRAAEEADAVEQPDPSGVLLHIYAETGPIAEEREPTSFGAPVTMVDAVNHALREEMERNPKIFMWGEAVADPKGGVFGATRGLRVAFPGRVENAPRAEASIVGVAQGMAIAGRKPVLEIQFSDDSFPAFMQLRNEIPTLRWRSNNAWSCPMVVRMTVGGYIRGGPYHSQTVEAIYAQTPGWRILYPSNAADAKGLLKTACRCDDPVLFLEHKGLYRHVYSKSPEPDADYLIPWGKARLVQRGRDLTAVTWGSQVYRCVQAAQLLAEEGISVEILDLRSIVPYDEEMILQSVRRTGRAVVIHEAPLLGGFGGEVASFISEHAFEHLDAPVRRVGAADCFVPFAPNLEAVVLPSLEDVVRALHDLAAY